MGLAIEENLKLQKVHGHDEERMTRRSGGRISRCVTTELSGITDCSCDTTMGEEIYWRLQRFWDRRL